LRDDVAFIIAMAQHANPKVAGHNDDLRAQLINESSLVVNTSGKASAMMFSSPILLMRQVFVVWTFVPQPRGVN